MHNVLLKKLLYQTTINFRPFTLKRWFDDLQIIVIIQRIITFHFSLITKLSFLFHVSIIYLLSCGGITIERPKSLIYMCKEDH